MPVGDENIVVELNVGGSGEELMDRNDADTIMKQKDSSIFIDNLTTLQNMISSASTSVFPDAAPACVPTLPSVGPQTAPPPLPASASVPALACVGSQPTAPPPLPAPSADQEDAQSFNRLILHVEEVFSQQGAIPLKVVPCLLPASSVYKRVYEKASFLALAIHRKCQLSQKLGCWQKGIHLFRALLLRYISSLSLPNIKH
jgi:hypothetical protein